MSNTAKRAEKRPGKKSEKHLSYAGIVVRSILNNRSAMIGVAIVLIMVVLSLIVPLLSPYTYDAMDASNIMATPSLAHPFGCDFFGRDILTRLLYGGRYSISLGLLSTALGTGIGVVLGAISGFFGGRTDLIIMRILDIFQAIPSILLSILIAAVLGAGYGMTVLALGVGSIPAVARIMRASILSVRKNDYVESAIAINCSNSRVIWKYVVPNAMTPILVSISNDISRAVVSAAGLSFIGLGVRPPMPEWGAMLSDGRNYIMSAPHMVLFPGIVIMIFVLAFNLFSDALRDVLDPKLKK
jgi:peptide/nickel transport system permease protein